MAIERIHPMVVHFPIALLITSVFLDFLRLVTKRKSFEKSAFHLLFLDNKSRQSCIIRKFFDRSAFLILFLGALGSIAAIIFGFLAEDAAKNRPNIGDMIETHEALAFAAAGIFILIARYIFMRRDNFSKIRPYYLVIAVLGIIVLLLTAFYGGQLVYDYGAAVSPAILK